MKKIRLKNKLFSVFAVLGLPMLLILLLEAVLVITGIGYAPGFIIPCEIEGEQYYCENPNFGRTYFPEQLVRPPIPFAFARAKKAETFRIFVLGGSAAQGDPDHTFGLSRMIETMLRSRYPELRFEVINTAMTAINSHVVKRIAEDVAEYEPDIFVVYMGNNEVVGPYGAGTVFSSYSPDRWLINIAIKARSSRIGQLVLKVIRIARGEESDPGDKWGGMEMFLDRQVRADDPILKGVYTNFRHNIRDIITAARKSEAAVILSTVAVNMTDSAPFASLHKEDLSEDNMLKWEELFRSGIALQDSGNCIAALKQYSDADAIDDRHADLHFRKAVCYLQAGSMESAESSFLKALEMDTLRFRADSELNRSIRNAAEDEGGDGIMLVDFEDVLHETLINDINGKAYFYDHVHLNFQGNYLFATNLLSKIEESFFRNDKALNSGAILTESELSEQLAFTQYDKSRIAAEMLKRLRRPPFVNQTESLERGYALIEEAGNPGIFQDSRVMYERAIDINASDPWLRFNYAGLMRSAGQFVSAGEQMQAVLQCLPHHMPARQILASDLISSGKYHEAIVESRKILKETPSFTTAYYSSAFAFAKAGSYKDAIDQYKKLLKIDPSNSASIYNEIGRIKVHLQRWDDAVSAFHKAAALTPKNMEYRVRLVQALESSGRFYVAIAELNRAVRFMLSQGMEKEAGIFQKRLMFLQQRIDTGGAI